jgi:hypothetical protein
MERSARRATATAGRYENADQDERCNPEGDLHATQSTTPPMQTSLAWASVLMPDAGAASGARP